MLGPLAVSANPLTTDYEYDQLLADDEERLLFFRYRSKPCACINPFNGTGLEYIGDHNLTCVRTKACYVSCSADCPDLQPAASWRRCYSEKACTMGDDAATDAAASTVAAGGSAVLSSSAGSSGSRVVKKTTNKSASKTTATNKSSSSTATKESSTKKFTRKTVLY
jgi:hypothetical protein